MLTACLTSSSYSLKQSHRFKEPEPTRRAFASSWRDAISLAGSSEFNQCSASVKKYCQTGVNTDFCHRKPASLSRLTSENSFTYPAMFWESSQHLLLKSLYSSTGLWVVQHGAMTHMEGQERDFSSYSEDDSHNDSWSWVTKLQL